LRRVYEIRHRENADEQIRPPSMKMCPPNYYLWGLGVVHREADGQDQNVMVGIKELHCTKPTGPNERDELTVVAMPEKNGRRDEMRYDGYTMAGNPFSLAQHLGKPYAQNDEEVDLVSCNPIENAKGGQWEAAGTMKYRDKQGRIRKFWLGCVPAATPT